MPLGDKDHVGMSVVLLRWVLVRDPSGTMAPKAFLCTGLTVAPLDVLRWFARRWSVEITFEEVIPIRQNWY